jgi:triphosphoribosyl-dephospho-CoA synthase
VLEVTACKPGNVHRFRDFEDLTYLDFILSAAAIAPVIERAAELGVGATVLEAIRQTRRFVQTNTNLGIALLLAPLAAVPRDVPFHQGIEPVLHELTVADARAVYEAIRLAQPGGLGKVADQDIALEPTQTLRQVMALAAERDLVARQYVNGFQEVLQLGVPALREGLQRGWGFEQAVIYCQLHLLRDHPDTLIIRKCGRAVAAEASRRAANGLELGWPEKRKGRTCVRNLDQWLRAVGHERNPGTTADLVTASLFVALREGTMRWPR